MRPSIARLLSLVIVLTVSGLGAQTPTRAPAAQPQFKGVFESVSYTQDLDLTDVFFVNGDVGWVTGKAGTILHTTDGGAKWTAQLGGDPENKAEAVHLLRFVDERHGWAAQGKKLLATRDGESWEEIGTLPYGVTDLAFVSPTLGFVAGKSDEMSQRGANVIYRTTDGGRTWTQGWTCTAKVQLGGLSRQLACVIEQLHFVTPTVGYAVAQNLCTGMGCEPPPLIAKTTDGGASWETMMGPGVPESDQVKSIVFLDERTGFARLSSKKLHMTTDGGATWRGIVASPGEALRFADPGVGWGIELGWTRTPFWFTSDGGNRWNSRELPLPGRASGYSLPRRDRAYIVGEHGMVFRYRVVPASQPMKANDLAAPAMPAFDSPLDEQVKQLEQIVGELTSSVGGGAAASPAGGGVSPAGSPTTSEGAALDAPLPPPSAFTAQCCNKSFGRLELLLGALSQTLPDFIGKYRNLNLLLAAVRMGAELPAEYRSVKGGLGAFRKAQDKEGAQAALASVSAALSAFKQTTKVSMQQQLPPATP